MPGLSSFHLRRLLLAIPCAFASLQPACDASTRATGSSAVVVLSSEVGDEGSVLVVKNSGTPLDGIVVSIPPGALARKVRLAISSEPRSLRWKSGVPSGIFVRISADNILAFEKPVTVRCPVPRDRTGGFFAIGYAVDDAGQLDLVSKLAEDDQNGVVTFSLLAPVLLTWVYEKP